jgi:PAS domain S-box-containing protein
MDVSAKAIAVVSASGPIRHVNGALLRTFAFTADELVGQPIQKLIPTGLKSDEMRVGGPHPAVVCGKHATHTTVQLHVVNSDGDDILLTLLESEEEDRRLQTISQTAIHEQIRGGFLARMSHELRTPLNAVLGTVSGMLAAPASSNMSERRGSGLSPAQTTGLETIRTAGESLLSLIVDILDFSTVHSENGPAVQFVDFNLLEVVTEALRIAAASMHFSYPGVVLFVDAALPLIATLWCSATCW